MVKTSWGGKLTSATGENFLSLRDFSSDIMISMLDTIVSLYKKKYDGRPLSWWKTLIEQKDRYYLSSDDLENAILTYGDRYFVEFNLTKDSLDNVCLSIKR